MFTNILSSVTIKKNFITAQTTQLYDKIQYMNEMLKDIALVSLMHDIPHVIQQAQLSSRNAIFFEKWTDKPDLHDFIFSNHLQKDLDNKTIDEKRIYAELIAAAENLSVAKIIESKGELSPLKSVYSVIKNKSALSPHMETFFHASEMSDAIILETERSKKDLYFAPSYLLTSFIEDTNKLLSNSKIPKINTLYHIIKKYLWSISLSHHGGDFCYSIFDHAKVTCAIACSLYLYLSINHKNVFISQNINFVREKINDPVEPRMILLKLNLLVNDSKYDSNILNLAEKGILISACHKILDIFHLYEPNILYMGKDFSLILLPNLNTEKIAKLIEEINFRLFKNYSGRFQISYKSQIVRDNDIIQHYSSSTNLSCMLWNDLFPEKYTNPLMPDDFYQNEYDNFFGPYKTDADKKVCPDCGFFMEDISSCTICENTKKEKDTSSIALFINKKSDNNDLFKLIRIQEPTRVDTEGIMYFFSTSGNFLKESCYREKIDTGFFPEKISFTQTDIRMRIRVFAKNLENHLNEYPNISIIHSYLSLIDIFLSFYFEKLCETYPGIVILRSTASEIIFSCDIFNISPVMKQVFDDMKNFLRDCPTVVTHIYFESDDIFKNDFIKFDLKNNENLFFLFDKSLPWAKATELLEKANVLINYPDIRNDFMFRDFLINISEGNFLIQIEHKYKNEILNFFDPQLLSKWILYLSTKEPLK